MKKSKSFVFDVDIYSARIHILYLLSDEEAEGYMQLNFPGLDYKRDSGFCARSFALENSGYNEYVIDFILPTKRKYYLHDTIAHESNHLMNYIFEDRNIRYDFKNPEPASYLLGFIVRKIVEGIFE